MERTELGSFIDCNQGDCGEIATVLSGEGTAEEWCGGESRGGAEGGSGELARI